MTEPAAGAPKAAHRGQAAALIRKGQHYLAGCHNEEAWTAWTTAIGLALEDHGTLDRALLQICADYLRRRKTREALRGGSTR